MRVYTVDYSFYAFKAEDDRGDYFKGKHRLGTIDSDGYVINNYRCDDGKFHTFKEHIAKWEYFNGRIPEGMQIDHIIPISMGGTNKLSNLRLGTRGDNHNNPLTRKNMSEARKGKKYSLGNIMSEESKNKISDSMKGKFINRTDQSNPVDQIDKTTGEVLNSYPSRNEAARQIGANGSNIGKCCKGLVKSVKGYIWKYIQL